MPEPIIQCADCGERKESTQELCHECLCCHRCCGCYDDHDGDLYDDDYGGFD